MTRRDFSEFCPPAETGHKRKWAGEPHALIVLSVHLPHGPLDDGCLDYELEHPPGCKQEMVDAGENSYLVYTCDVAQNEQDCGLAFSLRYSGTPVTEPGAYRIRGWGRRIWTECGDEYDGGIALMDPEAPG